MIVLDTSVLVAFWNPRDVHHEKATRTMNDARAGRWGRLLLPEYVFVELVTVLGRRQGVARAVDVARILLAQRDIDFVRCARFLPQAVGILRRQPDTSLGLVDAILVAIAQNLEEPNVATLDRAIAEHPSVRAQPAP